MNEIKARLFSSIRTMKEPKEYVVKKENHTGEGIRVRARNCFSALRAVLGPCRYRMLSRGDRHERWEIAPEFHDNHSAVYVVIEQ
jgi:hypothetical protein